VGDGFSMSFRLVWDPGIIIIFCLVQPVDHRVVMEFLEDKQSLGMKDFNVPIFQFPYLVVRGDFMSLCKHDERSKMRTTMRLGVWRSYMGPKIVIQYIS
jgi:hypothetical protein